MSEIDPFDEFEFKPITEGLGFHNRNTQNQQIKNQKFGNDIHKMSALDLPQAPDQLVPKITPPLPRQKIETKIQTPTSTVDDILNTLNEKKKYDFSEDQSIKAQLRSAPAPIYRPTTHSFAAVVLDAMLITAGFLACIIILLVVTDTDLIANILSPDANGEVYISMAALMLGLSWVYLVANRIFAGCTPGEWVMDQHLGAPQEVGQANYSMKVALRTTLVVLTGLLVAPALSLFTNSDYFGKITGLEILKKS